MIKILWVSRHVPLVSQVKALKTIFGQDCKIKVDGRPFASATDIVKRMKDNHVQELVLVAPLSVCEQLLNKGIKPLWADMREVDCNSPKVEVKANGQREKLSGKTRCYEFVRFRRLIKIELKFEDDFFWGKK